MNRSSREKNNTTKEETIIFTDLDGTLLDKNTYSYQGAQPGLDIVIDRGIPLIFCSAKTRAEQDVYRTELGIHHPFIVENGGAIFIPKDYFPFSFAYDRRHEDLLIIELGMPYEEIRDILVHIRDETGCDFKGFGDMSVEEVSRVTGLSIDLARRAKQREYDETVKFYARDEEVALCLQKIGNVGLNYAHGGRFYNVMGENDKGKAVNIVSDLYRRLYGTIKTVGLGDSLNDLPMLSAVDVPILVQKTKDSWETIELPNLYRVDGVGPAGWQKAITKMISEWPI